MKPPAFRRCFSSVLLTIVLAQTAFLRAADFTPFLTLKIDSPSNLVNLAEKFAGLMPNAETVDIKPMLAPFKKLPGVNSNGTINLAIQRNEASQLGLDFIIFLPIADLNQFSIPGMEWMIGMKNMLRKESGGTKYTINGLPFGDGNFVAYQKKGFFIIAPASVGEFAETADPKKLFADLDPFTLGVTVNLNTLSEDDIETLLENFASFPALQAVGADENTILDVFNRVRKTHKEYDNITWGCTVDEKTLNIKASTLTVPRSGSSASEKVQKTKDYKTQYAGFLHDTARTVFSWSYVDYLTDAEITQSRDLLHFFGRNFIIGLCDGLEPEAAEGDPLVQCAAFVFSWLQENFEMIVQDRFIDCALSLDSDGTFLYAQTVKQPDSITNIGKRLYDHLPALFGSERGAGLQQLFDGKLERNYERVAEYSLSRLSNPFTEAPAELGLPSVLQELPITLLWAEKGNKSIAVAVGLDAAKAERALKAALEKTASPLTPRQTAVIGLKPLGELYQKHFLPFTEKHQISGENIEHIKALGAVVSESESGSKILYSANFPGEGQLKNWLVDGKCLAVFSKLALLQTELAAQRFSQEFSPATFENSPSEMPIAEPAAETPQSKPTKLSPKDEEEMDNPFEN